jgi:hypothetical protein
MFIAETYLTAVADGLDIPIDTLRLKNLYEESQSTPFLQKIDTDWHIPRLLAELKEECSYSQRQVEVSKFNEVHKWRKRGMTLLPSKFGISFATAIHLNQGTASVKIYADGSILLHHGGTEMGQGLHTKMAQICAQELNVPLDAVFTDNNSTYYTANAAPTAASAGSDLNGMAVKDACHKLNARLEPYWTKFGRDASMKTIAHAAYLDRVDLSATGFWKMPKVGFKWGEYDPLVQKPMYYYFTQVSSTPRIQGIFSITHGVFFITSGSSSPSVKMTISSGRGLQRSRTRSPDGHLHNSPERHQDGHRPLHQPSHRLRTSRGRLHPRRRPLYHGRIALDPSQRPASHDRARNVQNPLLQRHPTGLQCQLFARCK